MIEVHGTLADPVPAFDTPDVVSEIVDLIDSPLNEPTRGELSIQINTLQREIERLQMNWDAARRRSEELNLKIDAVRGHIMDIYSMSGSLDDDIKEIAGYLDITLTKRIYGTATYEISFSAEVPLDFDADDLELSFSVECESYEAESFTWDEEDTNVNAEDEF
jgi:hypothetical protein